MRLIAWLRCSCTDFRQQDVDAQQIHRQHWIDHLDALLAHEAAEAFMGFDEALGLLLGDGLELPIQSAQKFNSFSKKLARACGNRSEDGWASLKGRRLGVNKSDAPLAKP